MANQTKKVLDNKVQKQNNRRFKIGKGNEKANEVDFEIEIVEDGDYEVQKLSLEGLPETMHDGTAIRWLNNFYIKKSGQYINQRYKITIPGLSNRGKSRLVIFDGNGDPYYYTGAIVDDTFEMTDGDPAGGLAP
jgi:hypothetical protein